MIKNKQILIFLGIFMMIGKFLLASVLDFDAFNGSGKFINAKGGVISSSSNTPYDDVTGKVYVSGDFGEDNYLNDIQTDKVFSALKFNGTVISDSPIYDAKIGNNSSSNEFYFILSRNKFNEGVIENNELGKILEAGYFDDNNLLKNEFYSDIKGFDSKKKLNLAINETFGINFYPIITKQTLEIVSDINTSTINSISSIDEYSLKGDIKMLGKYKFNTIKYKKINNISGYETESDIISFGAETKIYSNLKIGTMFNIIDSSIDMEDSKGYREDLYYQGGIYAVYDLDSVIYSTLLSAGGSYTDIYRYNKSSLGNFRNKANITNLFLGLNNSVYRKFKFNKSYISPKAELNFLGLNQGKINEEGDYGIEVDKINTLSIELGIGFDFEKIFDITRFTQLKLGAEVIGYVEIADSYRNLDARLKTISSEKYTIKKYNNSFYHTNFSLRQGLTNLNGLSFYLTENYILFKNQEQFRFGLNALYIF